ncbi:MAG TPA: hypothetical protein VGN60_07700 [Devosia sp.]|jgi:hypothetical protein|nr:hypothetical protein [Devosia sp.]
MAENADYTADEAAEMAWAKLLAANAPIELTARELDRLISALYRVNSAVFRSNSAIFALMSSNPEQALSEAKTAINEANIALANLNSAYKALKLRSAGGGDE